MEQQEQIIRIVTEVGNGAHIFAPREWLNEKVLVVRIEKKSINEEILKMLSPNLDKIICILLYGSYARGENEKDSDVDILVVAKEKFKIKNRSNFEFTIIQEDSLINSIKINPIMMYSIFREAKALINGGYLEKLQKERIKFKLFYPFIKTTKESIKSSEELIELDKKIGKIASNSVIYSLILRLRGVFIVESMLNNKKYSNQLFKNWVLTNCDINYDSIYQVYRSIRDGIKSKDKISIAEEEVLLSFLKEKIKKLGPLIKKHDK